MRNGTSNGRPLPVDKITASYTGGETSAGSSRVPRTRWLRPGRLFSTFTFHLGKEAAESLEGPWRRRVGGKGL